MKRIPNTKVKVEEVPDFEVILDEGERQMIVLALAKLTHTRPGWLMALKQVATKFQGATMFEQFRLTGPDVRNVFSTPPSFAQKGNREG